jgi:hypothetical protein
VIVQKAGKPALFAYFLLLPITSANFRSDPAKSIYKRIAHFFLDLHKVRVLVSGNVLRSDTACVAFDAAALSESDAVKLVGSVGEYLAELYDASAFIAKDLPFTPEIVHWFAGRGYMIPYQDQLMQMQLDPAWRDLDDYVACLGRKYKARARKITESLGTVQVREIPATELPQYAADMDRLFRDLLDRQSFVLTPVGPGYFSGLKDTYGDDFIVKGFFEGDELIAFYTAFVGEGYYEIYYVGFDAVLNDTYNLYFNMLFCGLADAIALEKPILKLGRTCFDAKASLGAHPVSMPYFVKTSGVRQVALNYFSKYFDAMESGQWKLRHPFKAAQA